MFIIKQNGQMHNCKKEENRFFYMNTHAVRVTHLWGVCSLSDRNTSASVCENIVDFKYKLLYVKKNSQKRAPILNYIHVLFVDTPKEMS